MEEYLVAVVVVLKSRSEECDPWQDIVNASLVQLVHDLWLFDVDVALLIFLGSLWTVLHHVSPDLGWAQPPAASFTLPVLTKN